MSAQKNFAAAKKPNAPRPFIEKRTFALSEVCTALGLSRPTVYGLINNGKLKSAVVGRRRLVTRTALDAYLRALDAQDAPSPAVTGCNRWRNKGGKASAVLTQR